MPKQAKKGVTMDAYRTTNIKEILVNIDYMFKCYANTANEYSRLLQGFSIAVEAQALATKLSLAADRWKYKLPFNEAWDVDFKDWAKRIRKWHYWYFNIGDSRSNGKFKELKLNTHYFIDLCYLDKKKEWKETIGEDIRLDIPYYMDMDAESSLKTEKALLDMLGERKNLFHFKRETGWAAICHLLLNAEGNKDATTACFMDRSELEAAAKRRITIDTFDWIAEGHIQLRYSSYKYMKSALDELIKALEKAEETLLSPDDQAYKGLYERMAIEYYTEPISQAGDACRRYVNNAPRGKQLKKLKDKLEEEKKNFYDGKWKTALEDYFSIEDIDSGRDAINAGKFIYKYRKELTKDELKDILTKYYKIICFSHEIRRIENGEKTVKRTDDATTMKDVITMELNVIFVSKLRETPSATASLMRIIREIAQVTSLKDKNKSAGRTWGHVKDALEKESLIDKNCNYADFGRAIAEICPDKKGHNVEQAVKRYKGRRDIGAKDLNIILEIRKKLQEVVLMLEDSNNG